MRIKSYIYEKKIILREKSRKFMRKKSWFYVSKSHFLRGKKKL